MSRSGFSFAAFPGLVGYSAGEERQTRSRSARGQQEARAPRPPRAKGRSAATNRRGRGTRSSASRSRPHWPSSVLDRHGSGPASAGTRPTAGPAARMRLDPLQRARGRRRDAHLFSATLEGSSTRRRARARSCSGSPTTPGRCPGARCFGYSAADPHHSVATAHRGLKLATLIDSPEEQQTRLFGRVSAAHGLVAEVAGRIESHTAARDSRRVRQGRDPVSPVQLHPRLRS